MARDDRNYVSGRFNHHAPNLRETIGMYIRSNIGLVIYYDRGFTLNQVDELTRKEIIDMYREISGDKRLDLSLWHATQVIRGDLQIAWYQAHGKDVPRQVTSNHEERMAKAKQAQEGDQTEEQPKKKRVTIRSVIETGLLAGTPENEILKQVKKQFPDSKADEKHIGYYRHFLIKSGQMEKPAKPEKAEKKPKTIEEAAASNSSGAKQGPAARRKAAEQAKGGPKPGRETKSTAKAGQ